MGTIGRDLGGINSRVVRCYSRRHREALRQITPDPAAGHPFRSDSVPPAIHRNLGSQCRARCWWSGARRRLVPFLLNWRTTAISSLQFRSSILTTAFISTSRDSRLNTLTLGGLAIAIGEWSTTRGRCGNIFLLLRQNGASRKSASGFDVVVSALAGGAIAAFLCHDIMSWYSCRCLRSPA